MTDEVTNHDYLADAAQLYRGIYSVRLNFTAEVTFVPRFDRDASWPPGKIPEDFDRISSEQEARLITVFSSSICITPHEERAGSMERWTDGLADVNHVLNVRPNEFACFSEELAAVAEQTPFVHDGVPLSSIAKLSFVQFVLEHVVSGGLLTEYELWLLGRP